MPFVELSDDDLARAAVAARSLAFRHEEHAKAAKDAAQPHLDQARRYRALARHLEEARNTSRGL